MKTLLFLLGVIVLFYAGIIIAAHTQDHFVVGHDYYWHGKKIATQPEDCSSSMFDTETGKVKFFGCGKDGNKTILISPNKES